MRRMPGLIVLVVLFTVLAAGSLWWQADRARTQLRAQAFEEANQRSLQLAAAMSGQVDGLLSSLDTALLQMRRSWALGNQNTEAFAAAAVEILAALPEGLVDYASVVDAEGHVIYNSLGVETGLFVGDRDYVAELRSSTEDRMMVGTPVQSRMSGRWVFVVSRALEKDRRKDEPLAGSVHLLVSTDRIAQRLAKLKLAPGDVVSLVHENGRLLAHSADNPGAMSRKTPLDQPYMVDRKGAEGVFRYQSSLDDRWRTAGWKRLPDSGVIAVVALSDESVIEPLLPLLRRDLMMKVSVGVLMLAAAGVIVLLLLRIGKDQFALQLAARDLERRVDARTRDLAVLNAELESFAYSVAHDLRTPLRSIHGFASLLEEELANRLDGAALSYLQRIQTSSKRMGQLITDLLSMSQLSRSAVKEAPVDLSAMARDIASELSRSDVSRSVEWQIEEGLHAQADPVLMRAVLQNLLGNAWKYTGQTPRARISLGLQSRAAGFNTFVVQDNGAGFDMAFVQQLFQPFRRLHAHHEFEGSGVGLATVKRIVERHGGSVSAEGVPGQGASFRFSLPHAED